MVLLGGGGIDVKRLQCMLSCTRQSIWHFEVLYQEWHCVTHVAIPGSKDASTCELFLDVVYLITP